MCLRLYYVILFFLSCILLFNDRRCTTSPLYYRLSLLPLLRSTSWDHFPLLPAVFNLASAAPPSLHMSCHHLMPLPAYSASFPYPLCILLYCLFSYANSSLLSSYLRSSCLHTYPSLCIPIRSSPSELTAVCFSLQSTFLSTSFASLSSVMWCFHTPSLPLPYFFF
jgi:hypothetical protein